jgi:hypothetical protein
MIQRAGLPLLGISAFLGLLVVVYRPVLFDDAQFAYRDAGCYYYPLYLRVQQEWDSGRWPLWDPGQNAGMPLLGNPTAAVLYPLKLIYAILSYPWATRLYAIAHTLIAFLGMLAFGRSLGTSWTGSFVAALSYAFGGTVLGQTCNVIFLVGAAWIPWGLRAIDRLLRQRKPVGVAELGAVLALQVLGGDPQAAYLTGVTGGLYTLILSVEKPTITWRFKHLAILAAGVAFWVVSVAGLVSIRPGWLHWVKPGLLSMGLWVLVVSIMILRWRSERLLGMRSAVLELGSGAALALLLAGAQLIPVMESAAGGRRAAGMNTAEIYHFGLEPFRVIEFLWPGVFGLIVPENRAWLQALPPKGDHDPWDASIYISCMIPLLAAMGASSTLQFRARFWLTTIALVALFASFGKFGGPLWWMRMGGLGGWLGPLDPANGVPRVDEHLGDGTGSVYSILTVLLPGFLSFRYPAKLTILCTAALAALAGLGWDRMVDRHAGRLCRWAAICCGISLSMLALAFLLQRPAIDWLKTRATPDLAFGPPNIALAWTETERALAHGTIALAALLAIGAVARKRPGIAAGLAMMLVTLDLGFANSRLVWTVPQSDFEVPLEAARVIEELERKTPSPTPYRVYRNPQWSPIPFYSTTTKERLRELTRWERETLRPLVGLPAGVTYSETVGNLELDDYFAFFGVQEDFPCPPSMAKILHVEPNSPICYLGRRSFDMWGARYLILPSWPTWRDTRRGFASFVPDTDLVYPDRETLLGAKRGPLGEVWAEKHDWQVLRNRNAYPRAWIVHSARVRPIADSLEARDHMMDTLMYMNDPFLEEPGRAVFDLRHAALIETDNPQAIRAFSGGNRVGAGESVTVVTYEPQRVELEAKLDEPGLVILADTFYPGWTLEIDGKPATILRANRLMRGAAVEAGVHSLVYRYQPWSFRVGLALSAIGIVALFYTFFRSRRSSAT